MASNKNGDWVWLPLISENLSGDITIIRLLHEKKKISSNVKEFFTLGEKIFNQNVFPLILCIMNSYREGWGYAPPESRKLSIKKSGDRIGSFATFMKWMIEMGGCEVGCIAKHLADWSNADMVSIKKSLPLNFRHLSLEGVRRRWLNTSMMQIAIPPPSNWVN